MRQHLRLAALKLAALLIAFTATSYSQSIQSFSCTPTSIHSGGTSACTVLMSGAAPSDSSVALTSNNAALSVPPSVTVPSGATSAAFTATAAPVTTNQTATVTGSLNGASLKTNATVTAPLLYSVACSPGTVTAGGSSTCTVSLNGMAAVSVPVALSTLATGVSVPASVTIAANSSSAQFSLTTVVSAPTETASIVATSGLLSKTGSVKILTAAQMSTLSCTPTTLTAGQSSTCTATLTVAAPTGGLVVTTSTTAVGVTVPVSITVPAGSLSGRFTVTTLLSAPTETATIAATAGVKKTAAISVKTAAQLSSFSCSPATLNAGQSSTCTATLGAAAPSTGVNVTLSATGATGVTIPASVTVAAGALSAQFTVTTTTSAPTENTVITATAGVSKTASLAITGKMPTATATLDTFACSAATISAGTSTSCTVMLLLPAPSGGVVVRLSTTATGLTIPSSIAIAGGQVANNFTVSASASAPPQTAVLTATSANTMTRSLGITGNTYQITSLTCTPTTIIPAQSSLCTVFISSNAPSGGLVANISSSSPDLAVPSSVNILATNNSFQFSATASAQTANLETVTLTVGVQTYSATASITINPYPAFYLRGNNVEISSLANGATVTPTAAPGNWVGTLSVLGTGYLGFDPITGTSGVVFHNGGSQNTNTAFINFAGQQAAQVFHSQGEVKFQLKSAYSFAQRQALPQSNARIAFNVYDATNPQFAFYTYTSGSSLMFAFMACGSTSFYVVPAGQEDTIFGAGVVAQIRITWTASSSTLYVNGNAVASSTFTSSTPNWTAGSSFTVGSSTVKYGGGNASDDAIAEIQIR